MRNRIKKIISTVLCAGLVAGLAGGCSVTGNINGGETNHSSCSVSVRDTSGV